MLGLIGQTDGTAIVVENNMMLEEFVKDGTIKLDVPTEVFSQTTKSPAEYSRLCARLEEMMASYNELSIERFKGRGLLNVHDTICSQVATRHERLSSKIASTKAQAIISSAQLIEMKTSNQTRYCL